MAELCKLGELTDYGYFLTIFIMAKTPFLLVATSIAVCFSLASSAQAPNLGSAASFAWFTAAGAVTNTGTTVIYGDVGTNVGAYTGSPLVYGNIQVADAVSAQAASDLLIAYGAMSALTCDSIIGTPFGNGLVLSPGKVYCLTTASQLTGALIFDAQGNPAAVFIIKINGALSTAMGSGVYLINSASFCNVYWQVGGALSIAESTVFGGTILADGEITLLNSAALNGRGLSKAGAMHLNDNIVIGCSPLGVPLPVTLLYFNAKPAESVVQLAWATASETSNSYFTVERSTDAVSFKEILSVSGAGNSNQVLYYAVSDYLPVIGTSYYRLRQNDFNGESSYSKIATVHYRNQSRFNIYPNPFSKCTSVILRDIDQPETSQLELKVYNCMGKEVFKSTLNTQITTVCTDNLSPGMYLYRIISNGITMQSGRMVAKE